MSDSGAEVQRGGAGEPSQWLSSDRLGGIVWILFGGVVFYASWTMDRLESQGVDPITAPGLLPGPLGLGMIGLGLILLLRRGSALQNAGFEAGHLGMPAEPVHAAEPAIDWRRLGLSWLFSVAFAGVLLGRGLPFWVLAVAFVFMHVLFLEDDDRVAARPLTQRILFAAVIAGGTAAVVTVVFQELFLIRLP